MIKNPIFQCIQIYTQEKSPFEVVVWIPLMDIKANSQSMFITSPKYNKIINNNVTYKKYYNQSDL